MSEAALGRFYADGEVVAHQGEIGDCMYMVQEGVVEIVREDGGKDVVLRTATRNELLGEMAIFDHRPRSATIRAKGDARILTLDKKNFLRRINEDPSLAFRMIETMSGRVRELSEQVVELETALAAALHEGDGEQPAEVSWRVRG